MVVDDNLHGEITVSLREPDTKRTKKASKSAINEQLFCSDVVVNNISHEQPELPSQSTETLTGLQCCDRCDGQHLTDDCPYYKKKRGEHPDAQKCICKKKVCTFD
jgi:hypothetical protein